MQKSFEEWEAEINRQIERLHMGQTPRKPDTVPDEIWNNVDEETRAFLIRHEAAHVIMLGMQGR